MRVVITHALRTPIGAFLGSLKQFSAVELGVHAVSALLDQAGLARERVDQLIFGNGRQAGGGTNPARQILIGSGIPETRSAMTINKACGSGLESIIQAVRLIRGGEAEIVVAGGTESMTRVPFELDLREGLRLGHATLHDGNFRDGFTCPLTRQPMGLTAETLAERYDISRREQDEYAVGSQQKAEAARKAGRFDAEIAPITVTDRKGQATVVSRDEHPRDGSTVEKLAKLPPVFKRDGTVHAGNSSGITDGAACVLVMSEDKAAELGFTEMAGIDGWTDAGVDPHVMGIGPVPAVRRYLERYDCRLSDFDLIELNEAFAAQVIACDRELELPKDKLNVNGGAIALGHPIGMTGCRIVVTLLHEMLRRDVRRGLATLCISGGLGMAVGFSR
jgi:acetyl-CoA C-acetyltransferase